MLSTVLGCLSAACFGYAAFAFCGRGPLLSMPRPDGAKSMHTAARTEYRAIAVAFAGLGLCFLSFAFFFLLGADWLAFLSVALSAAITGYACLFFARVLRPQRRRA